MEQCIFGDGEAVGKFELDRGCVALPDEHTQNLCLQHLAQATPLGTMDLIECFLDHAIGIECQLCGQK